jgi:hypothetical protein
MSGDEANATPKGELNEKDEAQGVLLSSPVQRKLKRTLNFDNFDSKRLR